MVAEGISEKLIPVSGYKLQDRGFDLVFRLELKDKSFTEDFHTLVIEYNHLGIKKKQNIEFDGFFREQDE